MRHPQEAEGNYPVNGSCDTLAYAMALPARVGKVTNIAYTEVCTCSGDESRSKSLLWVGVTIMNAYLRNEGARVLESAAKFVCRSPLARQSSRTFGGCLSRCSAVLWRMTFTARGNYHPP
jgi:hypothetical protein